MAKILIVDDDQLISNLLDQLLQMYGHQPTIVNDSTRAIEVANTIVPDLITLDLMMPGLSGFQLCDLLRADPKFAQTPIIIISAKEDAESKLKAFKAGVKDYVTKPFNIDDLLSRINALIS